MGRWGRIENSKYFLPEMAPEEWWWSRGQGAGGDDPNRFARLRPGVRAFPYPTPSRMEPSKWCHSENRGTTAESS